MAKLRELERTSWLERARDAKSDEEMLVALVSAWRAAPLVALCELVDAASARAARDVKAADQDAWLAAVKRQDPCELPALLANLQTGRLATSRVRAEALQSLPLDPRLIDAIRGQLAIDAQAAAAKPAEDFAREIWASPLDDGLREVFADWLGPDDPRAELIMLQLTRKRRGLDAAAQSARRPC